MKTARSQSGISRPALLGILFGVLVLGFFIKAFVSREEVPCETCGATGARACGAPACVNGRVPCTGPCLKKDQPGWQERNIPGHPPGLLWMEFVDADGARNYISQNHLGEVMEYVGGRWRPGGLCPTCNKTMRMLCPDCRGQKACGECGGKGKVRRWF